MSNPDKHVIDGEVKSGIELRPDGWERFRQAVHAAAKSGPKHRSKEKPVVPPNPSSGADKTKRGSK
jgi:hypothetical protein